jgi:ATPase subunit of ABC transporter with duplicated ATPase domains
VLAKDSLCNPDKLLLDEPTNAFAMETEEWLEDELAETHSDETRRCSW